MVNFAQFLKSVLSKNHLGACENKAPKLPLLESLFRISELKPRILFLPSDTGKYDEHVSAALWVLAFPSHCVLL